ncbi:MAG TPA: CHRD domain-containing protein [Actinomycetes bacterium]|nr:CHRD domain-containing protein [Actinomycetes bacterium]
MIRRMALAALAALAVAALAGPVTALAQTSGSDGSQTKQVRYGDDVYGGTEDSTGGYGTSGSSSGSSSSSGGSGAWTYFIARLTGGVEVPKGDPKGSGTASIRVRGTQVCYDVHWTGIDAMASHIHKAAAGTAGAIVVPFFAQETPLTVTKKSGCTTADASLVKAIIKNPTGYYVNVHSPEFPKGAIRGQLAKVDAATANSLPYTGVSRSKGLLILALCVMAAGSLLVAVGQRQRRRPAPARH